jgi:hypothetical protein
MPMKNPPHPGHSIKDACLTPLGLSVTEAANVLGIARHTLSRVLKRTRGHLAGNGDSAGEGRMVKRGSLATSADCL